MLRPHHLRKTTVLCAADAPDDWRWFEPQIDTVRWEFALSGEKRWLEKRIRRPNLTNIRVGLEAALKARRLGADVVIALEPRVAFWVSAMSRLVGGRTRLLAHTFNFTRLPHTLLPPAIARVVFAAAFARVDRFVVFSSAEAEIYSRYFGVPQERFDLVLWGMNVPDVEAGPPFVPGDYACAVGGNARDYATLIEAARATPEIPYVLVVRPDSLDGLDVPKNVSVHVNVSFARAMNIVRHSRFMVLPLEGAEVPCGHVTMVSAMHLGRAMIVTDSSGVRDYARHEDNALLVPPRDARALADAVTRLFRSPELTARLGAAGLSFATASCSEASVVRHLRAYFDDVARRAERAPPP
jgi:glycosyltransferase involved in cell wall biosynthesis